MRIAPFLALVLAPLSVDCRSAADPFPSPAAPPASVGHAMAYHDSLHAVLLLNTGLGGMSQPPSSTKTILWRWTGTTWIAEDTLGPPVRNLAGVAYDAKRNVLVMHGGSYDLDLVYNETWEWKKSTGWLKKNATTNPGLLDHTGMAYDPTRERVVLFGGQRNPTTFPTGTWSWDGATWQSFASGPAARVHHAMGYDPANAKVILFGGYAPGAGDLGDTWAWDGAAWSQAAPDITARTHAQLGRTAAGFVLLGGMDAGGVMRLGNSGWEPLNQTGAPTDRYLTAIAYDPVREVTVLFGGGKGNDIFGDTWEYNTSTGWSKIK